MYLGEPDNFTFPVLRQCDRQSPPRSDRLGRREQWRQVQRRRRDPAAHLAVERTPGAVPRRRGYTAPRDRPELPDRRCLQGARGDTLKGLLFANSECLTHCDTNNFQLVGVWRAASCLGKGSPKYDNTRLSMHMFQRLIHGANLGQFERQTMHIYANSTSARRRFSSA